MKVLVWAAIILVTAVWFAAEIGWREDCTQRACSAGKQARYMPTGRYTHECLCVEVPQ
jgi:hypothetical protein